MQTKLNWDKFKPLFNTWAPKIEPFFLQGGLDPIYEFLKKQTARGIKIAPDSKNVFRAFQETDINNLKVVLLSFCPYHNFINGIPVADGLAFSCSITNKLQPSLEKMLEGLEIDLFNGLNLNYNKTSDLTYLTREGCLLLNSSLTVEQGKPGSNGAIWEPFTRYILENVLSYTGIPILFIGKDAAKYKKYVTPLTHGHIFEIEHPSFAARTEQEWKTNGVFTKINQIVKQNSSREIDWLNIQECPF